MSYAANYTHCPRDGTALSDLSEWPDGTIVRDKYRVLAKIGQGGMGAVYKAQHIHFKELVALKVMAPELAKDPVFLKRFTNEAVITRMLRHPNAVRVEDLDEAEDGRPFIVMEYIEGRSLKDVIEQDAPLPAGRVCSVARQIASALDAAHRLGMVHRDIKPGNIVLMDSEHPIQATASGSILRAPNEPTVKVLDFGIAKMKEGMLEATSAGMTLTGTGIAIGTPSYMSPEQALGKKGEELDGRSDIYSLGVVLYQMLTGELPLLADTPIQMMMAHIQSLPRPLGETRHGAQVPSALAEMVMRCLEKNPELRPATGEAVVQAIQRWEAESTAGDGGRGIEVGGVLQETQHEGRTATAVAPEQPTPILPEERPQETESGSSRVPRWTAITIAATLVLIAGWYISQRPTSTTGKPGNETSTRGGSGANARATQPANSPRSTDLILQGCVNDFAGVLAPAAKKRLGALCDEVQQKTLVQMVVVTIQTLHDEPIEDFAARLFKQWGVGEKNENKGVLLLIAVNDQRDRLEVGGGLKGILPDGKAEEILRDGRPALRRQDYAGALDRLTRSTGAALVRAHGVTLKIASAPIGAPATGRGPVPASAGAIGSSKKTETGIAKPGKTRQDLVEHGQPGSAPPLNSSGSAGVYEVGGGVSAPTVLYKVEPAYSEEARKAKYQGTVILRAEIDTTGHAVNLQVIRGLGMGLDEKAVEAVNKWRFRPGYKDGRPVTVAASIEVVFRLL